MTIAHDDADVVTLLAPVSGVIVALDRVPDRAFAERMVGDGASIDPLGDEVLAPCDGTVLLVHRAHHAVTIGAEGLEIIIHVGLDTVALRGEGFQACVKAGDVVRQGDRLLAFDGDLVARRARSLLTQVIVTNMARVASLEVREGVVTAGRDVLMQVRLAARDTASTALAGEEAQSAPIRIVAESGLHARPAALLAAAARRFTADVRLVKGEQDANIRSVVSIMALEVAQGDMVTVVSRGSGAAEALAAITALLGGALDAGHAERTHAPAIAAVFADRRTDAPPRSENGTFIGVPASPGVAVGQVAQFTHDDIVLEERAADPNQERRALDAAIAAAHLQLETLRGRGTTAADAERAAIFAAHQELLEDPELLDRAAADIRRGASAAFAWRQAYLSQADRLLNLRSPLLAARATDLRDVGRRVVHLLVGRDRAARELPPNAIIIAEDLAPSDAASLDRTRVLGFCTTMGSATSHAAIVARGLGIPAVCGIDIAVLALADGTRVVLDGDAGTLRTAPTAEEERAIVQRQARLGAQRAGELASSAQPAMTHDGHRVEVAANVGDVEEADRIVPNGGEGVGLLRTEFLFMDRRVAPDEDEQTAMYERVIRAVGPERLVVIRTLDVGGDKPLPYVPMEHEVNPFLGERGVRLTLNRPELFRMQIRAILRASRAGRVGIMFPMIATVAEWAAARAMVEEERRALGVPAVQIGIMVETASAALLAERFARDADFLSIGTNDLTQYTLAMDRTNPRLAPQVDALHPAVLHLIQHTVAGAHAHGRWVGVCGALASDPIGVPVLVGLGVDELSADIPLVPAVKARVRGLSFDECKETARRALAASDGAGVRAIVRERHA